MIQQSTTMSALDLSDIAAALRTACDERKPIDAPTKKWTSLDAEGAFHVQEINSDFSIENGDRLVGYKLGNIARVMQVAFGLDHPDYGSCTQRPSTMKAHIFT
jgi:2-keto-4-pentenoate hydratase